jgi:hypothetical protein
MADEDASVDCLDIMEEAMKFFLRGAVEASQEKAAERWAQEANRAFKALARYRPLYNRLYRAGYDMRDLRQAEVLLEVLAALEATNGTGPSSQG